jgi:hypothetical protein
MAFMVISPAVPIYLVDYLHLSYAPISFAKGMVFHSALILFTPLMGKFHGFGNPLKFCGYVFIVLAFYPLVLISSKYILFLNLNIDVTYMVYFSYFIFGLGMSGVSIAWSLSSIYYAPKFEESNYQSIHITLTGLRGLFSPIVGYIIMKIFGIEYTFFLSVLLFILGGSYMLRENMKEKKLIALNTMT